MNKTILAYGEIMARLSPNNNILLEDATNLDICYGGSESNVLVALSNLNNQTSFISKIPDNALGKGVVRHLLRYNVGTKNLIISGKTLGLYFMEPGFANISSKVIYHRKNSEINTLKENDFDYEDVFKDISWFHVTGISLAISNNSKNVALRLCKEAKKRNVIISFDFNYRSTLWSINDAKKAYKEIIPYVDVCFGNVFDINNFLDIDLKDDLKTIHEFIKKYNIKYLINTSRTIISTNVHSLMASCYYIFNDEIKIITTKNYKFEVLDRIGSGDAFVAGIIHVLNDNFNNIECSLNFGLKCAIIKHFVKGDVLTLQKNEIDNINIDTTKDVKR